MQTTSSTRSTSMYEPRHAILAPTCQCFATACMPRARGSCAWFRRRRCFFTCLSVQSYDHHHKKRFADFQKEAKAMKGAPSKDERQRKEQRRCPPPPKAPLQAACPCLTDREDFHLISSCHWHGPAAPSRMWHGLKTRCSSRMDVVHLAWSSSHVCIAAAHTVSFTLVFHSSVSLPPPPSPCSDPER